MPREIITHNAHTCIIIRGRWGDGHGTSVKKCEMNLQTIASIVFILIYLFSFYYKFKFYKYFIVLILFVFRRSQF